MSDGAGREFMRRTRHEAQGPSEQQRGVPQPPLFAWTPGAGAVALPPPDAVALPPLDFAALLRRRASLRQYAPTPLTLAELSFLLWATQGVKELVGERATRRPVPSAGARHACETLVLANRVAGLAPGVYRYHPRPHQVELHTPAASAAQLAEACCGQEMVAASAATFFWLAVPHRMSWRYGERGYRYLHLDAGHICQNLDLAAEAVGAGVCAIAAFDDAALDRALGLDGETQFALYAATVGKRG